MKTPEEIIQWLKDNNLYEKYCANTSEKNYLEARGGLITILGSFSWSQTPEGYQFWDRAYKKFKKWYLS